MRTHAYAHTHTHTRIRTHTHMRTWTRVRTHTNTRMDPRALTRTYTCACVRVHTHTHTSAQHSYPPDRRAPQSPTQFRACSVWRPFLPPRGPTSKTHRTPTGSTTCMQTSLPSTNTAVGGPQRILSLRTSAPHSVHTTHTPMPLQTVAASKGLSTFSFRPHAGEAGSIDHLAVVRTPFAHLHTHTHTHTHTYAPPTLSVRRRPTCWPSTLITASTSSGHPCCSTSSSCLRYGGGGVH